VLGLIFMGAQFALALGGLWLLFALFSAGLVAMPTLALTKPDMWRGLGKAMSNADLDPHRVRRGPTLLAAGTFALTTVLAIALALAR
jgi:hypothetical protein